MKNITSTIKLVALSIAGLAITASAQAQCKSSSYGTGHNPGYKNAAVGIAGLQGGFISLGSHCNGTTKYGYKVTYVAPHSPAYVKGIKAGDILVSAGKHLISPKSWSYYKKQLAAKGSLNVNYVRYGKTYQAHLEYSAPLAIPNLPVFVSAEDELETEEDEEEEDEFEEFED